jgi:hypothetical protein
LSDDVEQTESSPRKRAVLIGLFALAVAAAIVIVVWVVASNDSNKSPRTSSSPGPHTSLVSTFSGRGKQTTKPFQVASNWEVKWRRQAGKAFTIELLASNGQSRGQIVAAKKGSTGGTFVSNGGTYKLKVSTTGEWSVKIYSAPTGK